MNGLHNPKLTAHAQELRGAMTKEERHLWYDFLKQLPVTCNRQKVIGPYIVDFYCAKAKLVIELDGSQHFTEPGIRRIGSETVFCVNRDWPWCDIPMPTFAIGLKRYVRIF